MQTIKMQLSELKRPERNIRIHTEKQLREFERSIRMFGQIRPLVVDEHNAILAGNGCYETLLRMGEKDADVYKLDGLTENQKKKLMIADNKLFGLGIDDLDTFNAFLNELSSDLDIPGYDEELLKSMVAEAEEVSEKLSTYGTLDDREIENIRAAGEKKDALIEAARDPEPPAAPTAERNEPAAETRRSVICPKCGEEIWL